MFARSYVGHKLPAEVISMVVDCLIAHCTAAPQDKRDLGLCSLTCRYWAQKCRPFLFRTLRLSCREDAGTLLDFARKDGIRTWIRFLVLLQKEPSCPWTHNIYIQFRNVIPDLLEITHILEWQATDTPRTASNTRSLHPSVPRPLSAAFYRCNHVQLVNLHLRSPSNLIDLAGKLNMCTSLHCKDISWSATPGPIDHRSSRGGRRCLMREVMLENCSDLWLYTWLCVTTDSHFARNGPEDSVHVPFIRASELQLLTGFLQAMYTVGPIKCRMMRLITKNGPRRGFSLSWTCKETEKCAPDLTLDINEDGMLVGITITYGADTLPESAMASEQLFASKAFNWVDIDSRLSKCVALSEFCVDIRARMIRTQDIKSIAYIMERACYLKSIVKLRCLGESDPICWVTYKEFREDHTDSMDTSHIPTPRNMMHTSFPADVFLEIDIHIVYFGKYDTSDAPPHPSGSWMSHYRHTGGRTTWNSYTYFIYILPHSTSTSRLGLHRLKTKSKYYPSHAGTMRGSGSLWRRPPCTGN